MSGNESFGMQRARWRWRPLHHLRASPRLSFSGGVFLAASSLLWMAGARAGNAVLLGFDLGTLIYLIALGRFFGRATPEHMRRRLRMVTPS